MNKTALIVGAGRMGTAIGYACAKMGMNIQFQDVNLESIEKATNKIQRELGVGDVPKIAGKQEEIKPDVIISAAPYHQNYEIAKDAISAHVPYCDLGGNVNISDQIHQLANSKKQSAVVFTDLGLAPGLVNILGEKVYQDLSDIHGNPHTVELRVGGLPSRYNLPMNPLKYAATWSVDGLLNEYMDECIKLVNGGKLVVPGLSQVEKLEWKFPLVFEAFNTSGGLANTLDSMRARGVSNVNYKTLRYPGHAAIMKVLIQACGGNKEKIKDSIKVLCPPTNDDEVYIYAMAQNDVCCITRKHCVIANESWSAMQQATAFPTAVVAYMLAEGRNLRCYQDIDFNYFADCLEKLGLELS